MKVILLIFVFVFLSTVVYTIPHTAWGDGFTQENLPPADVGNRKVSVFVKINPPIITSENNQERYLLFRWFNANTNQTIQHTSFLIAVTKHNMLLMQGIFHTHTGILTLKVTPSNDPKKWTILGTKEPFLDGYMYLSQNGTLDLVAPILGEGGLYHIYVILVTMDSDQNFFRPQDAPKFDSYLSVGDVINHTITYHNNSYKTTLVSYYDKTTNYDFDQSKMQISWTMPFDWNTTRFQNMPIFVHEELRIPKSFKEFASTPTFVATVNGNPITDRRIIVDPYSINDTVIVHILLNKIDLQNMARQISPGIDTMNFTLTPAKPNVVTSNSVLSDFGGWGIKLGWNPIQIVANAQNNLRLTFFDAFTEQQVTGDVNYDLKILDSDNNSIISKTSLTAKNATDTQTLNLPGNGIYRIQINIKSIINNGLSDTSRTGLARGNLVIPSAVNDVSVPEFGSISSEVVLISLVGVILIHKCFRKLI